MEATGHAYQISQEVQRELDRLQERDQWPFLPAHSYFEGNRLVRNYARQLLQEPSSATLTLHAKRHNQDEVARHARNLGLRVELGQHLVIVSF